ncbi:hypothetical protein KCV87_34035 [Actinosynnema pretiosum subsp. pretiosum]|uniref:NACHT N-terminal Helical domain-containing protein n=1 Tax=Actinosynnema pretiosum subsp. pretiosum TaxID=103721 RepID=A0AA45R455_9PSEU|nr:hypothetical protein APASM_4342 [Actinosynnema pretiosum subsp. pretiosum]QUF04278.1 hypothetical protein KCV87_34035 [Actinosynnema pretiosum subsp. pretiosum]
MPRTPALTFAGALRILGKHEVKAVERLDKALGGSILASGVVSLVDGGTTVLFAALWGWVDQKNEATRLLRELAVTEAEKRQLAMGEARDCHDSLYLTEIPAPPPSRGFGENLEHLARWVDARAEETGDCFTGLAGGEGAVQVFGEGFRAQVLDRYQSHCGRQAAGRAARGERGCARQARRAERHADARRALHLG